MENFWHLFLLAAALALLFGDPRDWWKSDLRKEIEKEEFGGGILNWIVAKFGNTMIWWYILLAIWITFVIIKGIWKMA